MYQAVASKTHLETSRKQFLYEEVLYVSDTATESQYPRTNAKNKKQVEAGFCHSLIALQHLYH